MEHATTPFRRDIDADHGEWIQIRRGQKVTPLLKVGGRGQGGWLNPLGRPVPWSFLAGVDPARVTRVEVAEQQARLGRHKRPRADTIKLIEDMLWDGVQPEEIARRIGVRPGTLRDTCRRADPPRKDLVLRMSPQPERVRIRVTA